MTTLSGAFHLLLHAAVPAGVAWRFRPDRPWRTWGILMATMAVDIDHLWADPIYDPGRCSVGFHPLHTWPLIGVYGAAIFWPPTRWVGVGLSIHMALDALDCGMMGGFARLLARLSG
jgi:hypothetical protein